MNMTSPPLRVLDDAFQIYTFGCDGAIIGSFQESGDRWHCSGFLEFAVSCSFPSCFSGIYPRISVIEIAVGRGNRTVDITVEASTRVTESITMEGRVQEIQWLNQDITIQEDSRDRDSPFYVVVTWWFREVMIAEAISPGIVVGQPPTDDGEFGKQGCAGAAV